MSADNSSWWRRRASDNLEGSSGPVQPSSSRVRATPDSSTTSWRSAAVAPVDRASAGRWNTHNSISTSTNAPESQRHNTNTAFASSSSGSDRRFDGAQLTARLRGANTPEKLQVLLEGHASTLSGQQLSAAFKGLSVMGASPPAVQDLMQQHLLPLLDSKVKTALAAHTANPSAGPTTSSSSSHTNSEVPMDGRACAVVLTSLLSISDTVRASRQLRHEQRAFQDDLLASAHNTVKLFLTPATLASATPQGFGMLAASAAKLRLQALSQRQLLQLLQGLLTAAAAVQDTDPELLQPVHVSQTLWGVATLLSGQGCIPPTADVQQGLCDVALLLTQNKQLYAAAKPVELVNTLSAFVIAEARPPAGLVRELVQGLGREVNLSRAIPQDLGRSLWAVARLERGAELRPADCAPIVAALCRPQTLQRSTGQDIANLLWGLGHIHDQQQQQRPDQGGDSAAPPSHFISTEQLMVLARRLLEQSKQQRVTPTDLSAVNWALAMLEADLPADMLQQLFAMYMEPYIFDQVSRNVKVSVGIVNTLWAAATLQKCRGGAAHQDGLARLLSEADTQSLVDMLTDPARVRHLTAAEISITVYSLAHVGYIMDQEHLVLLLQRFLQPSAQHDVLPKNFQNVCWGIVRMRQEAALLQDGLLQQLVQAWLTAGEHGGSWAGREIDTAAAANMLWAVAMVCRTEDTHERRWVELRARGAGSKAVGAADAATAAAAAAASIPQEAGSSAQPAAAAAAAEAAAAAPEAARAAARVQHVGEQQLRCLFESFMQHRSLAASSPIDTAIVLWSAAVLAQPLALDDLQWLLSAFTQQDRLQAAAAESISNVMYAVTHLQLQQKQHQAQQRQQLLQQPWQQQQQEGDACGTRVSLRPNCVSSSSSGPAWLKAMATQRKPVLPAVITVGANSSSSSLSAQQDVLVPVLVKLAQELVQRIPDDISSQDLKVALLSLAKAYVMLPSSSSSSSNNNKGFTQHQHMLQQALWHLLQKMLLLLLGHSPTSSPQQAAPAAAAAVVATASPGATNDRGYAGALTRPSSSVRRHSSMPWSGGAHSAQQKQQQRLASKHTGQVELCTFVDAVWASDIIGIAHAGFLTAVSKAAAAVWGSAAAAVAGSSSSTQPAVQGLCWQDTITLLEKLASLNHLTPELWLCAMQPLLDQPHNGQQQQQQQLQLGQAACRVQIWSEVSGFVPRLCWAAAAGNLHLCKNSVVLLCQLWLSYLADNQQQQQHRAPLWGLHRQLGESGASSSLSSQCAAAANSGASSTCAAALTKLDSSSLCQLWQVHMWLQDSAQQHHTLAPSSSNSSSSREEQGLLAAFSPNQLKLCEAAWKKQVSQTKTSILQESVAEVLGSIPGIGGVELESLTADSCFSVDMTADVTDIQALAAAAAEERDDMTLHRVTKHLGGSGCCLAVEADGPSHFVLTGPNMDNLVLRGEAQMRTRALQARDYVVLRVSFFDWAQQQQQPGEVSHGVWQPGSAKGAASSNPMVRWLAERVCKAVVEAGGGAASC